MTSYDDAAEALAQLKHHCGDAYDIQRTGPGTWLAARRDGKGAVHAHTPDELYVAISADYAGRPPRSES